MSEEKIDKILELLRTDEDDLVGDEDDAGAKDRAQRCNGAISEIKKVLKKHKIEFIGVLLAKNEEVGPYYTLRGLDNVRTKSDTAFMIGQLNHAVNERLYK